MASPTASRFCSAPTSPGDRCHRGWELPGGDSSFGFSPKWSLALGDRAAISELQHGFWSTMPFAAHWHPGTPPAPNPNTPLGTYFYVLF